jgi:Ca2+-binding EF-hand superfamily protein
MYRKICVSLVAAAMAIPAAAALPTAGSRLAQEGANPGSTAAAQPKSITRAQFVANLKARFDAVDTNHDGYLEENEIAAAQQQELQRLQAAEQQQLEAEFNRLDANHDGMLSKQEFMAAAPPVHARETPEQMIQNLDRHKLGRVSFQDYSEAPLSRFDKLAHNGVLTQQDVEAARQASGRK